MRTGFLIVALAFSLAGVACVERMVSIESVPAGATVWVNDREVGVTPCEFSFTHYGTFDVRVAAEGHEPLVTGAEGEREDGEAGPHQSNSSPRKVEAR